MQMDSYLWVADGNHKMYHFFSSGPKGIIKKVVQYNVIHERLYNVEFGDWDE